MKVSPTSYQSSAVHTGTSTKIPPLHGVTVRLRRQSKSSTKDLKDSSTCFSTTRRSARSAILSSPTYIRKRTVSSRSTDVRSSTSKSSTRLCQEKPLSKSNSQNKSHSFDTRRKSYGFFCFVFTVRTFCTEHIPALLPSCSRLLSRSSSA